MQKEKKIFDLLLLLIAVCLTSCAGMKETILKDNPEFEANVDKYSFKIKKPTWLPEKKPIKFTFIDAANDTTGFEAVDLSKTTGFEIGIISNMSTRLHLYIVNKKNTKFYQVKGKNSASIFSDRWIKLKVFSDKDEIGKLSFNSRFIGPETDLARLSVYDNKFKVEYLNDQWAFKFEEEYIALFELKGFSNNKGQALLTSNLSDELKSELLVYFVMLYMIDKTVEKET